MSLLNIIVILTLHSLSCTYAATCSIAENDTCPPGQFCEDGYCQCGAKDVYPSFFKCKNAYSQTSGERCTTFDESKKIVQTGSCPYYVSKSGYTTLLPNDSRILNTIVCEKPFNRTGALCGKCLPGHYPLVYSYNMTCIPCPYTHWNWLWYIMAAYLPLTFFYLFILFFKINTTSSHLFAVIYYCQTITMPALVRDVLNYISFSVPSFLPFVKALSIIYGIWNLDFFKPLYSSLCLNIDLLPTLALEYGIAVYPLFLMLVSYLLIELHDRNYRIVTIPCRPFQRLFSLFRRHSDIRTSVVDSYATFFFLSNTKLLSVSISLLAPLHVHSLYSANYSNYTLGLYYAADIEYFGREHLPYAILAIAVMGVCFVYPVMTIALYPFRFAQKFLALFPFHWFVLRTFMDSFHGCYKNGTEPGTRDYRCFVAIFFIARLLLFLIFFSNQNYASFYYAIAATTLLTFLIALLQPYKSSLHCLITAAFMMILTLQIAALNGIVGALSIGEPANYFCGIAAAISLTPIVYAAGFGLYWISLKTLRIVQCLKARRHGYSQQVDSVETSTLPHRIANSAQYPRENLANFTSQHNQK